MTKRQLNPKGRRGENPTKYTERKCLGCNKLFQSWGIANRLCGYCRHNTSSYAVEYTSEGQQKGHGHKY